MAEQAARLGLACFLWVQGFVPGGAPRYQKWYPFREPVPPLRARSHSPASGSAPPEGSARTFTLWSLEQVAIRRP